MPAQAIVLEEQQSPEPGFRQVSSPKQHDEPMPSAQVSGQQALEVSQARMPAVTAAASSAWVVCATCRWTSW